MRERTISKRDRKQAMPFDAPQEQETAAEVEVLQGRSQPVTEEVLRQLIQQAVVNILGTRTSMLSQEEIERLLLSSRRELDRLLASTRSADGLSAKHLPSQAELASIVTESKPEELPARGLNDPSPTEVVGRMRSASQRLRAQMADNEVERIHAKEAQMRMLPREAPRLPGFDIAYHYLPSQQVSGDFLDLTRLDELRLGIGIGDVSGHGLAAGLVMSMTRKALSLRARSERSPVAVLAKLNDDILPDIKEDMFVTALYGVLDSQAATFSFGRAGHTMPVLYSPEGEPSVLVSKGGALGVMQGPQVGIGMELLVTPLTHGSIILLYTDGITEAASPSGEQFGVDRLLEAIQQAGPGSTARTFLDEIIRALGQFVQTGGLEDDLTLVAIRRT
jgi:serine phosphatase RsbU (regulator of sigma subunit)